jgi:fatty acid desaturase
MAAALMLFALLFAQVEWMGLYQLVFALVFLLIVGFLGCVVWFLIEHATGRRTPWRQRENT